MLLWQILDVGSIWMKEFAAALGRIEQQVAWQPKMLKTGGLQSWQTQRTLTDPSLQFYEFPLQRGYSREPLSSLLPFQKGILNMLHARVPDAHISPLICSTPFYAPVAEQWPGPVVYYSTDLTSAYAGLDTKQVNALERRICKSARLVCPNSRRIAAHLESVAGCDPAKLLVVPNATRSSNIGPGPSYDPGPLPEDAVDLARPVAGVLGDLSGNMDWELIAETIRSTPTFSWLFVGPAERPVSTAAQANAREWTKANARFVGMKPYGELQRYARGLDVAVLPYRKHEPTYSGSSTRFYEHLAALRPMLATRGFAELLEKEPLLKLVDTAQELASELEHLHLRHFRDGHEEARWEASRSGTWEQRALTVSTAVRSAMEMKDDAPRAS